MKLKVKARTCFL